MPENIFEGKAFEKNLKEKAEYLSATEKIEPRKQKIAELRQHDQNLKEYFEANKKWREELVRDIDRSLFEAYLTNEEKKSFIQDLEDDHKYLTELNEQILVQSKNIAKQIESLREEMVEPEGKRAAVVDKLILETPPEPKN